MLYLVAVIFPPLAVLMLGKPVQALLNLLLTAFFWVPGIIHAVVLIGEHNADRRNRELIRALDARR